MSNVVLVVVLVVVVVVVLVVVWLHVWCLLFVRLLTDQIIGRVHLTAKGKRQSVCETEVNTLLVV